MKSLLVLGLVALVSCAKVTAPDTYSGDPIGSHSIRCLVEYDQLQYDTLRLSQESSYLILTENGTGSIKFYSRRQFDYRFKYSVVGDMMMIDSGELEGHWRIAPDFKYMTLVQDGERRRQFHFYTKN